VTIALEPCRAACPEILTQGSRTRESFGDYPSRVIFTRGSPIFPMSQVQARVSGHDERWATPYRSRHHPCAFSRPEALIEPGIVLPGLVKGALARDELIEVLSLQKLPYQERHLAQLGQCPRPRLERGVRSRTRPATRASSSNIARATPSCAESLARILIGPSCPWFGPMRRILDRSHPRPIGRDLISPAMTVPTSNNGPNPSSDLVPPMISRVQFCTRFGHLPHPLRGVSPRGPESRTRGTLGTWPGSCYL